MRNFVAACKRVPFTTFVTAITQYVLPPSVAHVLDEFSVPRDEWPGEAEATSLAQLTTLVFCWTRACTDMAHEQAEATAALATAEHVSITPSFADSTGRFVDVRLQRGAS